MASLTEALETGDERELLIAMPDKIAEVPRRLPSCPMTVAVFVKVYDGLVLAADSATSIPLTSGGFQVYNTASKVFHLHRRKPIGAMTWGMGSIGAASIATLSKDFRRRVMGLDPNYPDWELGDSYTIEEVAERMVEMFYDELFLTEFPDANQPPPASVNMVIAGYSGESRDAEAWKIELESAATRPVPIQEIGADQSGWVAYAQPEAVNRLFYGIDPRLYEQLRLIVDPAMHAQFDALIADAQRSPLIPSMPFPDAITLARFMVETTSSYVHYLLGPNIVGGVAEVAGITRHEGFRWIKRKHFYPAELNPLETGHDY